MAEADQRVTVRYAVKVARSGNELQRQQSPQVGHAYQRWVIQCTCPGDVAVAQLALAATRSDVGLRRVHLLTSLSSL